MRYKKHIFICENKRPDGHPRGCCATKGSAEIKEYLKSRLKEEGMLSEYRANTAGCLDACEFGPSIVVYPEQVWYGAVSKSDVDEIIESHLKKGKPVERLMIRDQRFERNFDR
ncbi:MAG: (2Fe-2S) ferredoxin domain-containing protein [Ignavibacteriaceae bacterium]|nr:(2Fe-2S) ferredoxin domain-containing protein [Ignavibacteriaceae bacterium]